MQLLLKIGQELIKIDFQIIPLLDAKNTPRTKEIEKYLEETLKFRRVENEEIVILYPYDNL